MTARPATAVVDGKLRTTPAALYRLERFARRRAVQAFAGKTVVLVHGRHGSPSNLVGRVLVVAHCLDGNVSDVVVLETMTGGAGSERRLEAVALSLATVLSIEER